MRKRLQENIKNNFPFITKTHTLLVAVSGGVDSMVLLHSLVALGYKVCVAHCNFKLRAKESDTDESFVVDYCKKHELNFFTEDFLTSEVAKKDKISIQMAARNLRYDWFSQLSEEQKCDFIVTAHHKNDIAETVLINLVRGTSVKGLSGIPKQNNNVIRPLLPFTKEEILRYAQKNKISWREDTSNQSEAYLRNSIRKRIIPELNRLNPSFLDTIEKMTHHLNQVNGVVEEFFNQKKDEIITNNEKGLEINISTLKASKHPELLLYQILKKYGFTEWENVNQLVNAQTGKRVYSQTHTLLKNRDSLLLQPLIEIKDEEYLIKLTTEKITKPLALNFIKESLKAKFSPSDLAHKNCFIFDFESLVFPLQLRRWKSGDYFYPLHLGGKKKVSRYFIDAKFSEFEKLNSWILTTSENNIITILGQAIDDRFKVTSQTKTIYKIQLL